MQTDTAFTHAAFTVQASRRYGVLVSRSRVCVDEVQQGWWALVPIAGYADLDTEEIVFAVDDSKPYSYSEALLNYALAHELGHILECREQGLELYMWRKAVELLEIETEAWERANDILREMGADYSDAGWDEPTAEAVKFRELCLDTYRAFVATDAHQAQVDALLARGKE